MADNTTNNFGEIILANILRRSDIIVAIGVVSIVIMMIIPLPAFILDLLIALNISIAIAILLISMYMENVLAFSVFPSLLLIVTLFRLALNISSTRLILLQGITFGGKIIRAFGNFVVGGNYVVGIVIFIILVIIQFMVITKGSTRVAEVAARFTLDAMPGKQMSVDAELQNGTITEEEAKKKREDIQREADFYGAMDGASKFVQGDAIAGIIITFINVIGGLIIGTLQRGEPLAKAAQTYTLLTVGDGLVSQIPALLISVATGIIVTRAASESDLGSDITTQFFINPKIYFIIGGVLGFLAIIPGLPTIPFFILSFGSIIIGFAIKSMNDKKKEEAAIMEEEIVKQEEEKKKKTEDAAGLLQIDKMELELGYNLISIADKNSGGDLPDRLTLLRRQMVMDLGLIIPPIRIRDNLQLKPNEYLIIIKGMDVARGILYPDKFLAMNVNNSDEKLEGVEVKEPVFGIDAVWIDEVNREEAELLGFSVIDATTVLITHITKVIEKYASELLGMEELDTMLEHVAVNYHGLVEEIKNTDIYKNGLLLKVLHNLLMEGISIRNMIPILEVLLDKSKIPDESARDPLMLTEFCRIKLGPNICRKLVDESNTLNVITIDPPLEETLINHRYNEPIIGDYGIHLDRDTLNKITNSITKIVNQLMSQGITNIIFITNFELRRFFARFIKRINNNFIVLSYNELPPDIKINSVGILEI